MSAPLELAVQGVGLWAPGLPDVAAWRAALDGAARPDAAAGRPAAAVLAPGERRRAPESVLLACEVAAQACADARRAPAELACVFSSMQGDSAIMDYMCTTLADDPRNLSPTRFHNSVHNAAAGYWTIATGCHAASTAVSGGRDSFAAGLLEAAVEVLADSVPVLYVAYDIGARGALAEVVPNRVAFGVALVLDAATRAGAGDPRVRLRHRGGTAPRAPLPAAFAGLADANAIAGPALALLGALAGTGPRAFALANGDGARLELEITP